MSKAVIIMAFAFIANLTCTHTESYHTASSSHLNYKSLQQSSIVESAQNSDTTIDDTSPDIRWYWNTRPIRSNLRDQKRDLGGDVLDTGGKKYKNRHAWLKYGK